MGRDLLEHPLLRDYRIEARLGAGAQAVTWRAVDTRDGRAVVVKQFALSRAESWKEIELFRRECDVLAALEHPGIPSYVDSFEETAEGGDTELYLVQELIPAPSLAELMDKGRRWSQDELVGLARRLLEIVGWLHARNPPVIHRDIKPSNVLRHDDGRLALIDFTAVQLRLHADTGGGSTVVGTHGYMAPEQLLGRAAPASDLYAVGMTLVHLASAHHPGELPMSGLRIDFRAVVKLDERLTDWLVRLTEPDPGQRPPSAEAALEELEQALVPAKKKAPSTKRPTRRTSRRLDRKKSWTTKFALVAVPAAILLAVATRGSNERMLEMAGTADRPLPVESDQQDQQIRDIPVAIEAPDGLEVEVRAARIRLGGSFGEPTQIDVGYLLKNRGATPIERVRAVAVVDAVMSEGRASLTPVSNLQVPLEPGETRAVSGRLHDVPRTAKRVVLRFATTPAEPLPPAAPREVPIEGLATLPIDVAPKLLERRALRVDKGMGSPRRVFDVELTVAGSETLFSIELVPTCVTPDGPKRRNNDRDFTLIFETLGVRTILDGDVSTFRAICRPDTERVTWKLGGFIPAR